MSEKNGIVIRILKQDPLAVLPEYETDGASGADLRARLSDPALIPPMGRRLIPTGLRLEIPPGYEAQVRPRSGLAIRHGVTLLNSPGTIDCDYRGELQVILVNLSDTPYTVRDRDRIAQIVFARTEKAFFEEAGELSGSIRGTGGFGSTGV